jgi:hypothetical protein
MAEIYGLFSGRDGKVRYVGMTAGDREVRFKEHQRVTSEGVIMPVLSWMRREWRCGYPVECVLLERCEYAVRHDVETCWINKFPDLLNERKVNWLHNKTAPVVPEIKKYIRSFIFNSGGFRGIHWWRHYDMYSVFVGGNWLGGGDAVPGRGGSIYYSHRTDALIARDRYRRGCGTMRWLPDAVPEAEWPEFAAQVVDMHELDFDPSIHAAECDTAFKSEFAGTIA